MRIDSTIGYQGPKRRQAGTCYSKTRNVAGFILLGATSAVCKCDFLACNLRDYEAARVKAGASLRMPAS